MKMKDKLAEIDAKIKKTEEMDKVLREMFPWRKPSNTGFKAYFMKKRAELANTIGRKVKK